MRKKSIVKITAVAMIILATSIMSIPPSLGKVQAWGNKALVDTNNKFEKAIINTFDGSITVDVKTWDDFDDGINIQIVTTDGKVYYTSFENVILIHEK